MKIIKTILLHIYLNWQVIIIGAILLGKYYAGLSLWWLTLPAAMLVVFWAISTHKCLASLRFITWPFVKHYFFGKVKKISPLVAFPYLIWMTFEGRDIYIREGHFGFQEAFVKHGDSVCERLTNLGDTLKQMA